MNYRFLLASFGIIFTESFSYKITLCIITIIISCKDVFLVSVREYITYGFIGLKNKILSCSEKNESNSKDVTHPRSVLLTVYQKSNIYKEQSCAEIRSSWNGKILKKYQPKMMRAVPLRKDFAPIEWNWFRNTPGYLALTISNNNKTFSFEPKKWCKKCNEDTSYFMFFAFVAKNWIFHYLCTSTLLY